MPQVTQAAIPAHLTADTTSSAVKAKNAMGKDDFMKLLMTQLTHQDPLKPMDHHEFAAQLAQFGSLEQLTNIQKGIAGLHTGIGDETKLSALSMIGKKIETAGNEATLVEGQSLDLTHIGKDGITPVKVAIYDMGGKPVREIDLSKKEPGAISWDGKDNEGKNLPSGKYTFRVQGIDKAGQSQELATELSGRVTGVEMEGKSTVLIVQTGAGKTKVDIAKVKNVSADTESVDKKMEPVKAPVVSKPIVPKEEGQSIPAIQMVENDSDSGPLFEPHLWSGSGDRR